MCSAVLMKKLVGFQMFGYFDSEPSESLVGVALLVVDSAEDQKSNYLAEALNLNSNLMQLQDLLAEFAGFAEQVAARSEFVNQTMKWFVLPERMLDSVEQSDQTDYLWKLKLEGCFDCSKERNYFVGCSFGFADCNIGQGFAGCLWVW